MKKTIKNTLLATLAIATLAPALTACTVWENEQIETIPQPETDIPVIPEPWETEDGDVSSVGD
jgi:hypothetical protein